MTKATDFRLPTNTPTNRRSSEFYHYKVWKYNVILISQHFSNENCRVYIGSIQIDKPVTGNCIHDSFESNSVNMRLWYLLLVKKNSSLIKWKCRMLRLLSSRNLHFRIVSEYIKAYTVFLSVAIQYRDFYFF